MGDRTHIAQEGAPLPTRLRAGVARWRRRARTLMRSRRPGRLIRMFVEGAWRRGRDVDPPTALLFPLKRYVHRYRTGALPSYRVLPFDLPPGVEHVGGTRFVIEVDRITTYCGFSYASGGWHPFLEVLREYEANPALTYEDSALCRLYARLCPATVLEAVFDDAPEPLSPLDRLPATHEVMKSLWQLDRRSVRRWMAGAPYEPVLDDHSRYLGPKTPRAGAAHFQRILAMYHSVREHGYDPARFGGGRPRGYFLVRDGAYRFVMSRGNHRIPALHHLGYRELVATVRVRHPPVVDARHLRRWSTDEGGAYPLSTARQLFERMFTATGAERADALDLR